MKTQKELINELKIEIKELSGHQKILKAELNEQSREYNRLLESNPSWSTYSTIFKETVGFKHNPAEKRQQSKLNIRCYLLAYGFLRGVPYNVMEQRTTKEPEWVTEGRARRVHVIYKKYFAADNRLSFIEQEDIKRAFLGDDNGN